MVRTGINRTIFLMLLLAGVIVTVWPVGETLASDRGTVEAAHGYTAAVEDIKTSDEAPSLNRQILDAQAYNSTLSVDELADPWGEENDTTSAAHDTYLAQLNLTDAMARLTIPAIAVDVPIYHDASNESLARGVGHMFGSSLPVGGESTHSVLAAHTGERSNTFFDRLPELAIGDIFHIDVAGERLTYQVDAIHHVLPDDLELVKPVAGEDLVTLVTCFTPEGGPRHAERLLVRGSRVADTATVTSNTSHELITVPGFGVAMQHWMWPRVAVSGGVLAVSLLCIAWWAGAALLRKKDTP